MPIAKISQSEISEGESKVLYAGEKRIAVFKVEGNFYAIDDTCTHAEASLSQGVLKGKTAICPLHGAEFDITTGKALSGPSRGNLGCYQVKLEGRDVVVEA